jgi:transcription elongation factor B subunit 1
MASATSQPSEFVTLVSRDGHEFVINRSAAYVSSTLRRMLDPSSAFSEAQSGKAKLSDIRYVESEPFCSALPPFFARKC